MLNFWLILFITYISAKIFSINDTDRENLVNQYNSIDSVQE